MYKPVGSCIYCGCADEPLTREHIIPYALGGTLVLPKSSCEIHQKLTSKLELDVARITYGLHRAHENIPPGRKRRHLQRLDESVTVEGVDKAGQKVNAQVKASRLPRMQMIVLLKPPSILYGDLNGTDQSISYHCKSLEEGGLDRLANELGWSKVTVYSPVVTAFTFERVLAKIAHAYAFAEGAFEKYSPTLPQIIFENNVLPHVYVGGFHPQANQSPMPLQLYEKNCAGRSLLVAEISLTKFPSLPRYQVVCGIRDGTIKVGLPLPDQSTQLST